MSWLCKSCETINSDDVIECDVCGGISPHLCQFDYDEISSDKPTTIRWKAEACDKVCIKYNGHVTDVTGLNSIKINVEHDTKVVFCLYNELADREYVYDFKEYKLPIINANKNLLREGKESSVELSWNIENAKSAVMNYNGHTDSISLNGSGTFPCEATTVFEIDALSNDGRTHLKKSVTVQVCRECNILFSADKDYTLPGVPVRLSWNVTDADEVKLGGKIVDAVGGVVVEPDERTVYKLTAHDAFGYTTREVVVNMLPIPVIEAIKVPMPDIQKEITINANIPRINFVNVGVGLYAETPKLNTELPDLDTKLPKIDVPKPEFVENEFLKDDERYSFGDKMGKAFESVKKSVANKMKKLKNHGRES